MLNVDASVGKRREIHYPMLSVLSSDCPAHTHILTHTFIANCTILSLSHSLSARCAVLALKYAFLYMPTTQRYLNTCVEHFQRIHVNVIYKVDATNRYHNYPPLNSNININNNSNSNSSFFNQESFVVNDSACSTPVRQATDDNNNTKNNNASPHRTCSHYGHNCPLTNAPNIMLHPENRSIWLSVVEQREKVVSFIDLTALSFAKRKMLHVLSGCGKSTSTVTIPTTDLPTPPTTSYVSAMQIQLEPQSQRKNRKNSANDSLDDMLVQFNSKMTTSTMILQPEPESERDADSCQQSANDSLDEMITQFSSKLSINTSPMILETEPEPEAQAEPERDDYSLYPSSYVSRNFLPDNHAMAKDTGTEADKPEAEQIMYQTGDDSGLGLGSSQGAGRRQRLITTSNESSTQEAEAYSQGKHIRLTLSSSPEVEAQLKSSSIEILINVSLHNSECMQTVQQHEQEFRSKLEKVIDDEIHYISQQLTMQHRTAHLLHSTEQQQPHPHSRAPLATPTPSTSLLLQRSNSAPALCHTYSYVALPLPPHAPPSTPTSSHSHGHNCGAEPDELQRLQMSLDLELQHLLNNIMRAHALHNRAVIECHTRISQICEDIISGVANRTRVK